MSCSCTPGNYFEAKFACRHIHAVNVAFKLSLNDQVQPPLYYVLNGKSVEPNESIWLSNTATIAADAGLDESQDAIVDVTTDTTGAHGLPIVQYDTNVVYDEAQIIQSKVRTRHYIVPIRAQ